MSPSSPSASSLIPAVKYRAPGVTLSEPAGNRSPHSPEMVIGPPWVRSWPRNWPVVGLKALIRPSPKFPTRMSPPKAPKVAGASVTAHGELSRSWLASRCSRVPFGAKTSTKPLPGPASSSCLAAFCLAKVTYRLPPMLWIPNGAKPAGTVGSVKLLTWRKLLSKTSMVPNRKLVAYRNLPAGVLTRASPLYTAPWSPAWSVMVDRSTAVTAWVRSTAEFQPAIVPSSVANRNLAGAETPFLVTTNPSGVGLNTVPSGAPVAPGPADGAGGIVTTSCLLPGPGWGLPCPSYRVVTPVALSETQIGRPGPVEVPQALRRFGSVCRARPGMSETRLVCW